MSAVGSFSFKRIAEGDLAMLRSWLLRPHVAQWWGTAEPVAELREDFILRAQEDRATSGFIASLSGRPIGFIQSYWVMGSGGGWWENETDPGARGIDQFLANADDLGKWIGRAMIRSFVGSLFEEPETTVVQTDPSRANERAIRCYKAAGFTAVEEVETPDGPALLLKTYGKRSVRAAGAA